MKNEKALNCLINTCYLVNSSLEIDEVLRGVTITSKNILKAEAGSLMLINENTNTLDFVVALGLKADKLKKDFSLKIGQGIAGWVAEKGIPLIVPDVEKDTRFYKQADKTTGFITKSILAVPLKIRDKTIGVLELINPQEKQKFTEQDIPMFQAFACQVAVAVQNARMHKKILEQQRFEYELSIAAKIQKQLLPKPSYQTNAISIKSEYKPAKVIGGDFFDYIDLDEDIIITIGDVSGKGIPAALYMVNLISELRTTVRFHDDISKLAVKLNNALLQKSTMGMFTTAVIIRINKKTKMINIVNAGHPEPIIIDKCNTYLLSCNRGLPLGIVKDTEYPIKSLKLKEDCSLLLYTDGIIEARNTKNQEFGTEQLIQTIKDNPDIHTNKTLKHLFQKIEAFSKGMKQHDDLTAVMIKI